VKRRTALGRTGAAWAAACVLAATGCLTGESADRGAPPADETADGHPSQPARDSADRASPPDTDGGQGDRSRPPSENADRERSGSPRTTRLRPARCPPGAAGCRTASGRIIYVERVDPDGDGDAHFVLASRDSITGPGISVIDVKRSLRPSPLPGRGDRLSAAGPVYRGSYGQRQIQAIELHVARGP
jgi:hypothetical protein